MKLSARCYAVTGLGYSAPWTVNAGFVAGDEATLVVDTGANSLAAATIHGYASAVRPTNRILVFNTEKHFDHIGGNSWFEARSCEILGHSAIQRTDEELGPKPPGSMPLSATKPAAPPVKNEFSFTTQGSPTPPAPCTLTTH